MKMDKLNSSWETIQKNNRMLLYFALAMAGTNILLGITVANQGHTVVLVPNNLSEKAEVASNRASQGYKKGWGMYAATLLGNITPENADFVLDSLSGMVTSEIKAQLGESVRADIETLKTEKVTATFELKKIAYEPESDKVFVTGKHWITGAGAKSGSTPQTFEFKVAIRDYSPTITHLALYEGEPRTVEVVKRTEASKASKNQTTEGNP